MSNKKTIDQLVNELTSYQNSQDKIIPLLKSFLYSEYYATQLCRENNIKTSYTYKCEICGHISGSRQLSLSEKVSKLIENKIISEDLYSVFNLLNKLRNRLLHDINPNTRDVIKWIGEYDPPANSEVKNLLKKANAWLRFYLCLIPAIAQLYDKTKGASIKLSSIEYNNPTGNWIFHFE